MEMEQPVDFIRLRGALHIHLLDPGGKVLEERIIKNTVVTQGRSWVLGKGQLESVNNTTQVIGFLAIGSVTNAPTTADTALGGEVTRIAVGTFVTSGLLQIPLVGRLRQVLRLTRGILLLQRLVFSIPARLAPCLLMLLLLVL